MKYEIVMEAAYPDYIKWLAIIVMVRNAVNVATYYTGLFFNFPGPNCATNFLPHTNLSSN